MKKSTHRGFRGPNNFLLARPIFSSRNRTSFFRRRIDRCRCLDRSRCSKTIENGRKIVAFAICLPTTASRKKNATKIAWNHVFYCFCSHSSSPIAFSASKSPPASDHARNLSLFMGWTPKTVASDESCRILNIRWMEKRTKNLMIRTKNLYGHTPEEIWRISEILHRKTRCFHEKSCLRVYIFICANRTDHFS